MCNANNHPADCRCGWGGDGHAGSGGDAGTPAFYRWPIGVPRLSSNISSFTVPNARCPVCGAQVFYYCNEFGSSVFFDELGPPWTKHPCTTKNRPPLPAADRPVSRRDDIGRIGGWMPLATVFAHDSAPDLYKLSFQGPMSDTPSSLYVQKRSTLYRGTSCELHRIEIALLKPLGNGVYRFEFLASDSKTYSMEAFASEMAARSRTRRVRSGRARTVPRSTGKPHSALQTEPKAAKRAAKPLVPSVPKKLVSIVRTEERTLNIGGKAGKVKEVHIVTRKKRTIRKA